MAKRKRLKKSIKHVKESREMEERFMLFQELLRDERAEGRAEGRAEALTTMLLSFLEDKGVIPENLQERIMNEKEMEVLGRWIKLAAKAESIDQFLEEM